MFIQRPVKTTFYALSGVFLVILCQFFVPPVQDLLRGPVFLVPFFVFSLLGTILFFQVRKNKGSDRKTGKFLLLTGGTAAGFFVFVVAHNLLEALSISTESVPLLPYLFEGLAVASFLIATIVCPIGFIVGAIAVSGLLLANKGKK